MRLPRIVTFHRGDAAARAAIGPLTNTRRRTIKVHYCHFQPFTTHSKTESPRLATDTVKEAAHRPSPTCAPGPSWTHASRCGRSESWTRPGPWRGLPSSHRRRRRRTASSPTRRCCPAAAETTRGLCAPREHTGQRGRIEIHRRRIQVILTMFTCTDHVKNGDRFILGV